MASVKPDQKHCAFRRFRFARQFLGALMIVVQHSHPNPPISCRTRELQHLRGMVATREMIREFGRLVLIMKSANLHCPFSTGIKRHGRQHQFDLHFRHTRLPHIDFVRRSQ